LVDAIFRAKLLFASQDEKSFLQLSIPSTTPAPGHDVAALSRKDAVITPKFGQDEQDLQDAEAL